MIALFLFHFSLCCFTTFLFITAGCQAQSPCSCVCCSVCIRARERHRETDRQRERRVSYAATAFHSLFIIVFCIRQRYEEASPFYWSAFIHRTATSVYFLCLSLSRSECGCEEFALLCTATDACLSKSTVRPTGYLV